MRTDGGLIYALLRQLEKIEPKFNGGTGQVYAPFEGVPRNAEVVTVPGYNAEQIFRHLEMLFVDPPLVEVASGFASDPAVKPYIHFCRLTDAGHQVLGEYAAAPPKRIGFL
ncbi:MAG TPA: hypothetical protein VK430_04035 [Xanthobacteraceae bacterium]|nr:hypothetical protein [Xanthobacteraceae bacterium]